MQAIQALRAARGSFRPTLENSDSLCSCTPPRGRAFELAEVIYKDRRDPEFDLQLATCRPLEMAQRFFGEATSKSRFDAYLAKFTGFADESPLGIW
jgi:hypothetical protein